MLSFIPRIFSLVFAPSTVIVVISPSSSILFNDDKLALPLPSSSLSALDQLRYVQTKFNIQAPLSSIISSDEKRANKSLTIVVQAREEESARGGRKVVDAGGRELGSSSSIPSCVEAAASKPLRDQKLQATVDELLKLSRFEDEEEEEELQCVFAAEEVKLVEIDEERLELAKVVAVRAAAAGLARRREQVEKKLHRAETLAILAGKPHRATELAARGIIEDRRLYNFLADSRKELRLPSSGVLEVWEEEGEIKRQWRAARRLRVEYI